MSRNTKKKSSSRKKKTPWAVLFWLAFLIFLLGLYLFNREAINNSVRIVQKEVFGRGVGEGPDTETPVGPGVIQVPPPTGGVGGAPVSEATPPAETPPPVETQLPPEGTAALTEGQNAQPQMPQGTGGAADLRDRAIYFAAISDSGSVLRVRTDRRLPASESPLRDVMEALIAGPNAEESQKGLISLIPPGTRLLSVTIRGETAYINFNEDFQYNIYGAEGYYGQLRQVVYTATEFPTVADVQILIEGNRVDYMGESFWIGSPLSREML